MTKGINVEFETISGRIETANFYYMNKKQIKEYCKNHNWKIKYITNFKDYEEPTAIHLISLNKNKNLSKKDKEIIGKI